MVRKIKIDLVYSNIEKKDKIIISAPFSEELLENEKKSFEIYGVPAEADDFVGFFCGNEVSFFENQELEKLYEEDSWNFSSRLEKFYEKNENKFFIEYTIFRGYVSYIYIFEDVDSESLTLSDDGLKIKFLTIK